MTAGLLTLLFGSTITIANAATVAIPAGTQITMHPTTLVISEQAHPGDEFELRVAEPVVVNGWVVIPSDARAHGHVVSATTIGSGGYKMKMGSLSVAYDWVETPQGRIRLVSDAQAVQGKKSNRGGFIGHAMGMNTDTPELDTNTTVVAMTAALVHVNATQRYAGQSDFITK